MKKKLFFLPIAASLVLLATSCKKDDDTPTPPLNAKQVVKSEVTLENFNKNADNTKSVTWYSAINGVTYTMEQVKANLPISANVDFGFNSNDTQFGLFSPSTYPQAYGQNTWTKLNSSIFKFPVDPQAELKDKILNQPTGVTVALIDKNFNEGTAANSQITDIATGQVLAFQAAGGNKGLIYIKNLDLAAKTVLITVFLAK